MYLQTSVKIVLGLLVFVLVLGYGVFRFSRYVEGPMVSLALPINGATIEKEMVSVKGHTKNIASITLNGGMIHTDPQGHFKEKLLLDPGYNVFEVSVTDRFGRTRTKQIELVYRPDTYSQDGSILSQKPEEPSGSASI